MIYNFNNLPESGLRYGGNAGSKKGVIINNENWLLKFPKTTKDYRGKIEISYTTSPLSEYIGSHIYESIGIPVHQTLLGECDGKIVVACKDFRKIRYEAFDDYNSISNDYVAGLDEKLKETSSSDTHSVNLDELIIVMNNNPLFIKMPELKERFWDMFIVDSLIGNNDRNNGNWGVIVNNMTSETRIAPVFDNGSAFNNKAGDNQMEKILNDEERFITSVYTSRRCIFSQDDKPINPLQYIETLKNEDCNKALKRIVPNIEMDKIFNIIYSIENEYKGLRVTSDIQKKYYYECIKYRYEKVLLPAFEKYQNQRLEKNTTTESNLTLEELQALLNERQIDNDFGLDEPEF